MVAAEMGAGQGRRAGYGTGIEIENLPRGGKQKSGCRMGAGIRGALGLGGRGRWCRQDANG